MKQLNCWVADDLAAEVEQAAAADGGRSVSSWIRRLIMIELRSQDASEPEEAVA